MLTLPPSTKVHLAALPTNMQKSFDGLALLARFALQQDPLSGHLFVFFNRTCDRVKVLWWDGSGFCIFAKRLEKGRFCLPDIRPGSARVAMDAAELALILEGIDLKDARRRPRWNPLQSAA